MNLSNDPAKMEIVNRLVKEGAIDFNEAIKLLEREVELVSVPVTIPANPVLPQWQNPWIITCDTKTNTPFIRPGFTVSADNTINELLTFTESSLNESWKNEKEGHWKTFVN